MRDIGQFLSVPLGFQRSLRPSLALPDRSTLSQAIDKHSFLHAASSAAERISFPLYLTCSSGSQQTVKGHKTAGRKACKYLNHYLSEGPDLSFTARTGCNLPARPVPSPQTAQSHTHICMQTDGLRGAAEKSEKCKCNCTRSQGITSALAKSERKYAVCENWKTNILHQTQRGILLSVTVECLR